MPRDLTGERDIMYQTANTLITFSMLITLSVVHAQDQPNAEYQPSPGLQEVLDGKHSPEEFRVSPEDDELTRLMKQQINVVLAERRMIDRRIEVGDVAIEALLECDRRLCNALIGFYANQPRKQIEAMERRLEGAIMIEKQALSLSQLGTGTISDYYRASANRIGVELDLLRLKEQLENAEQPEE